MASVAVIQDASIFQVFHRTGLRAAGDPRRYRIRITKVRALRIATMAIETARSWPNILSTRGAMLLACGNQAANDGASIRRLFMRRPPLPSVGARVRA